MAIMLPDVPRECHESSMETLMFDALKQLPDDYYVFHSFSIITVDNNVIKESETDFVIFNASKGIMCLEAKAGHVYYENGEWYYQSGKKMKHGGPYKQAEINKFKLIEYIQEKNMYDIISSCKFTHAVWFPSISVNELHNVNLPSEADSKLTLTSEALQEPQSFVDRIFSYRFNAHSDIKVDLAAYQIKKLINSVLCPSFKLVPSVKNQLEQKRTIFNKLLLEQIKILDYLEEQPNAAISGVAGSGKTMIAVEKARRCTENGDSVLFLCYNRFLKDFLAENYKYQNVDFYTLDGFASRICGKREASYQELSERLENLFYEGAFPYRNIVIDEGQDFGQEKIEESKIIDLLYTIVMDETVSGSFYIFYDKLQLIQGKKIPDCIINAECRLTLYKNCRNTENIAVTSMRPFPALKKTRLFDAAVKGEISSLVIKEKVDEYVAMLNRQLDKYIDSKINSIVILTCATEQNSCLSSLVKNGYYLYRGRQILMTTCRKFKGLEADVIMLVDIVAQTFLTDEKNLFYVGSSRARFNLEMFALMDEHSCNEVLKAFGKENTKRPQKALATLLNAEYVK